MDGQIPQPLRRVITSSLLSYCFVAALYSGEGSSRVFVNNWEISIT